MAIAIRTISAPGLRRWGAYMFDQIGLEYAIGTATLVHLATLTYVMGFVLTNQFALRGLVLLGSVFYIAYYYLHLGTPQWDAIAGTGLIVMSTLIGLAALLLRRMRLGLSREHSHILDLFGVLQPGEFRALVGAGRIVETRDPVNLTEEGVQPERLYFVIAGAPLIEKDGTMFQIGPGNFIGEVGFLLEAPASATVTLPDGGHYVEWDRAALIRVLKRNPDLGRAFDTLLGKDMAAKLAASSRSVPVAVPMKTAA